MKAYVREGKVEQEELTIEMRSKHLEVLQSAITRMARNSAAPKSYTIGSSASFIGFSAAISKPDVLFCSAPLISIFSFLDGHYLRLEHAFWDQFDSARKSPTSEMADINVSPSRWAGHSLLSGV